MIAARNGRHYKKQGISDRVLLKGIVAAGTSLALAFGLLICIEAGLRMSGFGTNLRLFTLNPHRADGSTWIVNKNFYAQFFPPDKRQWVLDSLNWGWEIPLAKPPDTKRIMVIGGSVALGNQIPPFASSRILKILLEQSFPDTNFEIYNLAAGALNSNVMRLVVNEAAQFQPDFLLVYMGNNEHIGPYGPAWSPKGIPPNTRVIQTLIGLQRLRLVQLLQSKFSHDNRFLLDSYMSVFDKHRSIPPDSPGRLRLYENYRSNLIAICEKAEDIGAITILSTLGNNVGNWPPNSSILRSDISETESNAWKMYFEEGILLKEKAENSSPELWPEVLNRFLLARDIDAGHAELQYNIGECYYQLNDFSRAREAFTLARDLDGCFMRADSTINAIIRECSSRSPEIFFLNTEGLFIQESDHGIMGDKLFYDFVHVNVRGEYLIALSMFGAIQDILMHKFQTASSIPPMPFDVCMEVLGFSPYIDACLLKGTIDTCNAIKHLYRDLETDAHSEKLGQLMQEFGTDFRENALERLRNTALYKKGDVPISRFIIELLMEIEQEEKSKQKSHNFPSLIKDVLLQEGEEMSAKNEALRLLKLFPTRPDVHQLAIMTGASLE